MRDINGPFIHIWQLGETAHQRPCTVTIYRRRIARLTPVMDKILTEVEKNPNANILVTDMRYQNEMKTLGDAGFTTVKITRKDRAIDRDQGHPSEVSLRDAAFNIHIENDHGMDEYIGQVEFVIGALALRGA